MKLLLVLSAARLVYTMLVVVGAAVDAAGCCSTSKLGSCALSSSIWCTFVLVEAAHAPPCLYRLEAGVELPLFFWLGCLFLFLFLFLFLCFLLQAAARSWDLTLCRSLCLLILACLCKLWHISSLSWIHADHVRQHSWQASYQDHQSGLSLSRLSNTRSLTLPFKPFTTAISLMTSGSCSPESC